MYGRNHKKDPGENSRGKQLRDNLLVTAGARAAHMECLGYITLPSGSSGEDKLAMFVSNVVDKYLNEDMDISFDEYIEEKLSKKYRKIKEDV